MRKEYYRQILLDLEKDKKYLSDKLAEVKVNLKLYDDYASHVNDYSYPKEVLFEQTKLSPYFQYLTFNTNTVATLQSTGDIKLIPAEIRNQLIDYRNVQDAIVRLTSGNNEMYLRDLLTSVSLGYQRLAFWGRIKQDSKLFNELGVQQNIPRMVLTLDAAFGFKWLTEKSEPGQFLGIAKK